MPERYPNPVATARQLEIWLRQISGGKMVYDNPEFDECIRQKHAVYACIRERNLDRRQVLRSYETIPDEAVNCNRAAEAAVEAVRLTVIIESVVIAEEQLPVPLAA